MATVISGDFEWDDAKALANLEKHGVSFDEAALALASDDLEYSYKDPEEPDRVHSLAMSLRARVLLIGSIERAPRTRIITARKATSHELRAYESQGEP